MENIIVKTSNSSYAICFKDNFDDLISEINYTLPNIKRFCIISDSNVAKIYADDLKSILLDGKKEVYSYVFESGEQNKGIESILGFYNFFLDNKFDRKTTIIALGGGVTGDMAGFGAATYLRGIPFIQIPTTLLAQVDSSVGGKVGIDFGGSKNIVGAFYQPKLVYINSSTLNSLPEREFSAGMAEVIKYGCILSEDFYDYIQENKERIKNKDINILKRIIADCCVFKAKVVAEDEKESGLREILNFGHTIGHAVESVKNFSLLHGECVGIGMVAAMYISYKRGALTLDQVEKFKGLLTYFNIPVSVSGIEKEKIYSQMFNDKKVKDNKIGFVLLKSLGQCYSTTDVNEEEIIEAIDYIL